MGTINIDGTNFSVMSDSLIAAQNYAKASIGPGATAWRALVDAGDDDQQGRLLVQATRILYSLAWAGTPTVSTQRTAWPRNGVVLADGTVIADGTTPTDVKDAEVELALQLAVNPTLPTATDSGSNIQRMKAGPVEIEFFKATTGNGLSLLLPKPVWDLISKYLSSSDGVTLSKATGTCGESYFDECGSRYPYTRNGPF